MRLFLCAIFTLLPFFLKAQTVHSEYLDGVLYARQDSSSSLQLDPYTGGHPYLDSLINEHGIDSMASTLQNLPDWYRIEFQDSSEVDQLEQALLDGSTFDQVEKMPYFTTNYDPNDPFFDQEWHLDQVKAPEAWDLTRGDASISIAIVDNAVSTQHEDLEPDLWVNEDEVEGNGIDDDLNGYPDDKHGYDVADGNGDPNPPSGSGSSSPWVHGTHVGGIAGGSTDNGTGTASLGFDSRIVAVKCSPDNSSGEALTHAYEGVDYAIEAGANVINMSFGSPSGDMVGDLLLQQARNEGIVLVGAAGNNDTNETSYPAGFEEVIAVGATDPNDQKAGFSNYGDWVDLMAPGTFLKAPLSGGSGDQYGELSGTSMAAPVVSGIAALVRSEQGQLNPGEVEQYLEDGADDISSENPNYSGDLGAGRVNAFRTLDSSLGAEEEQQDEDEAHLYPRPNDGRFVLHGIGEEYDAWRVFDLNGKTLVKGELRGIRERFSLELPAGTYFLQLQGDKGQKTLKLPITDR